MGFLIHYEYGLVARIKVVSKYKFDASKASKPDFSVLEKLSEIPILLELFPRGNMDFGVGTPPTRVNQTDLSSIFFYVGLHISFSPTVARKYEINCLNEPNASFL